MEYPQRRFIDKLAFFNTGHPSFPLQYGEAFASSAPGPYKTPVLPYPRSDCYQSVGTSAPKSIYEPIQTESLPAPMICMDGSFLPFDTYVPIQSFDGSPFAFQLYPAPMACPPAFQIPHPSQFTYSFETTGRGYNQDVKKRTPTPFSSTASSLGSQDSNVWDTCSSTAMSPSSSFDDNVPGSDLINGHTEGEMTGPSSNRQVVAQPAAIDAAENIREVDKLLGKWTRGGTTWYYVKWKGFDDEHSTWEKRNNISADLIAEFV